MRETIAPDHAKLRTEIERHTAEFIARGGKIQEIGTTTSAGLTHAERCEKFKQGAS